MAVTGLSHTFPGQGLGIEPDWSGAVLQPVLTYRVELPDGTDPHTALQKLRQLEEEDPQLHIVWRATGEIHVQLMGEVQMEILQRLIRERLGMEVTLRHRGRLLPGDHRQRRWRASATLSRCGTMRRCICCWSPASRAAA